jgi:hypothetical protein
VYPTNIEKFEKWVEVFGIDRSRTRSRCNGNFGAIKHSTWLDVHWGNFFLEYCYIRNLKRSQIRRIYQSVKITTSVKTATIRLTAVIPRCRFTPSGGARPGPAGESASAGKGRPRLCPGGRNEPNRPNFFASEKVPQSKFWCPSSRKILAPPLFAPGSDCS